MYGQGAGAASCTDQTGPPRGDGMQTDGCAAGTSGGQRQGAGDCGGQGEYVTGARVSIAVWEGERVVRSCTRAALVCGRQCRQLCLEDGSWGPRTCLQLLRLSLSLSSSMHLVVPLQCLCG